MPAHSNFHFGSCNAVALGFAHLAPRGQDAGGYQLAGLEYWRACAAPENEGPPDGRRQSVGSASPTVMAIEVWVLRALSILHAVRCCPGCHAEGFCQHVPNKWQSCPVSLGGRGEGQENGEESTPGLNIKTVPPEIRIFRPRLCPKSAGISVTSASDSAASARDRQGSLNQCSKPCVPLSCCALPQR